MEHEAYEKGWFTLLAMSQGPNPPKQPIRPLCSRLLYNLNGVTACPDWETYLFYMLSITARPSPIFSRRRIDILCCAIALLRKSGFCAVSHTQCYYKFT